MHCHGHLKTGGVESGLDLDQRIHFRARIILHAEFRTMFFWFRTTPATLLYETKVKIHTRSSELILWFPINTTGAATCTMCIFGPSVGPSADIDLHLPGPLTTMTVTANARTQRVTVWPSKLCQ